MKRLFRTLFLASAILLTIAKTSYGKQKKQEEPATVLPEITLSCTQSHVDVSMTFGTLTVTFHVLVTDCSNGDVYFDFV